MHRRGTYLYLEFESPFYQPVVDFGKYSSFGNFITVGMPVNISDQNRNRATSLGIRTRYDDVPTGQLVTPNGNNFFRRIQFGRDFALSRGRSPGFH
jgi:hypothetical protein